MTTESESERFYSFDPNEGFVEHATAEDAHKAAVASLEYTGDGWPEGVQDVEWGRLLPLGLAREVNRIDAKDDPTGKIAAAGWDYKCGYELAPQPDQLALLRAERDQLRSDLDQLSIGARARAGAVEAARSLRGHCDWLEARVAELETEAATLRARAAELEAPPVVPEGWELAQRDGKWSLLALSEDEPHAVAAHVFRGSVESSSYFSVPVAALAALLHAHRTNPHAGYESVRQQPPPQTDELAQLRTERDQLRTERDQLRARVGAPRGEVTSKLADLRARKLAAFRALSQRPPHAGKKP